jgi:glucokinase
MPSNHPRLLADIGGTNARFAWQAAPGAPLVHGATLPCAAHESLEAAVRHYLQTQGLPVPAGCAIGIANPVTGDPVQMTNHHWSFSASALRRGLGLERLAVVNDFTALALALPLLTRDDLHLIGGGEAVAGAPMALIGPGTGLGVSGLMPAGMGAGAAASEEGAPEAGRAGGARLPLQGEGGHVTLAATDALQEAVLRLLRKRFGHASAERALSGPGLVNLYEAACELSERRVLMTTPAEVLAGSRRDDCPACTTAVQLFCQFLGSVAGNLALTLGARGGVYIGGGIVPRMVRELEHSGFRAQFEAKGRFRDYLRSIPVFVIDAPESPALRGAGRALDLGLGLSL